MKIPKQEYAAEFRALAVKWVKDGQGIAALAFDIGLPLAKSVSQRLAARAAGREAGSMTVTIWKTKNRGNLS